MPKVSCIIIFLNEERFLAEAVESILAQTFADWELLLVDDGSSDRSASIATSYVDRYPGRIFYFTHPGYANRGMSASRNLGLQHARGRYVAFLDGDDVWMHNKLAEQVALFEQHPEAVMICGATEYWHSWDANSPSRQDRIVYTGDVVVPKTLEQNRLYWPTDLIKMLYPLGRGATPSASGYMFTRSFAEAVGGFENAFRGLFEDQVFRVKAYLHGPIFISSSCFDRYRQHPDSCVHVAMVSGLNIEARFAFLTWLKCYLDRVGCNELEVRWRLKCALFRFQHPIVYRIATRITRIGRGALGAFVEYPLAACRVRWSRMAERVARRGHP
jgi:glycosyltransferase involved in cell wall biosynthesis